MADVSICTIDGCGKTAEKRGWCSMHHSRWKRHGDPLTQVREFSATGVCTVEGCDRDHVAKGYCSYHYEKHANPSVCKVEGCGKVEKLRRGMCGKHYRRWQTHGDPLYVMPKELRKKPGKKGPTKFIIDPDWLRDEYHVKQRMVGELAAEIGCTIVHLNWMVERAGIPRRDGRIGRVLPTRRAQFDLQRAIWLYEIDRKNCDDIGAEMGCHGTVIRRRLREAGVRIRHQNETKRGAKARNRLKLNEAKVVREYLKPFASKIGVAEMFGVSSNVIGRILDERKVPLKRFDQLRDWKGDKHPQWNPELTPEDRERARPEQPAWRVQVFHRDKFTCQACGDDRGGNLHAHHIEAHCENKEARWHVSNGVTLCATCHREFHRRYGVRGFGRAELDTFLASYQAQEAA